MSVSKALYQKIKGLLREKPEYADNTRKLCCRIWYDEIKAMDIDPDKISAKRMLMLYRDKKLTDSEYIGRARRKVEKENPALRGKDWQERQEKQKSTRKRSGNGIYSV